MAVALTSPTGIPGPPRMPVLGTRGNFLMFLRDPLAYVMQVYQRYGSLAAITRGDHTSVLAVGPAYNRLLLSDAARFYTIFETITSERIKRRRRGIGLLNMNGDQHTQQRRLMLPAFHRTQVDGYRDDMVRFTEAVLDRWQVGQRLDMAHELRQLTLRIACQTLFGLDVSARAPALGQLVERVLRANQFAPQVALFPFDVPGTPFHRMVTNAARLEDEMLALIARKRAVASPQHDVLALLIQARDADGSGMTDVELLGQTLTLLLAGHETTANTLTWTLFLLAQYPSVLADVRDELEGVLGGDAPTVEQLRQLPLLDQVIKESLRLLPLATLMSRISMAPFALGPYAMPKGAIVTISPFATHRLPDLYTDPPPFTPRRWDTLDPSPYEYLPFGAGPRMCIGATFALLEAKLVLALLLQRYGFALLPGTKVDYQVRITLSPKGGLPMVVTPRQQPLRKTEVRGTIRRVVDL